MSFRFRFNSHLHISYYIRTNIPKSLFFNEIKDIIDP